MANLRELSQLIQQGISEEKVQNFRDSRLNMKGILSSTLRKKYKSEIVCISSLDIGHLINVVAEVKESMSCMQTIAEPHWS